MRPMIALTLAALAAAAEPLTVLTDAGWKASAGPEANWTAEDFDDATWDAATPVVGPARNGDHYSVRNTFGFESKAAWLWNGNQRTCAFRRTFEVPAGFRRAEMMYCVDDVAEIWINGESADKQTCPQFGHRGSAVILDLLPWLREGTNVIAVHGTNLMGPCGFAAEVRIDGKSFVELPSRAGKPLVPEVISAVREFAKLLDSDDESVRSAAEAALLVLARQNGPAVAEAVAKEVEGASAEAKARAGHLREALHEDLWTPKHGPDARWSFAPWTPDQLRTILSADFAKQWSMLRALMAARVRMESDSDAMLAILRRLAEDGPGVPAERAVRIIVGAGIADGTDSLREVLKARPDSREGAFAAAGLARFGNTGDLPALETAASSGNAATARAAKAALRILKK